MKLSWKTCCLAAAVAFGASTVAQAAPFLNLEVLGSTTSSGTYSSNLQVTPGQTVYYEVVGYLSPAGAANSQKNYTLGAQAAGANGFTSVELNMADAAGQSLSPVTLNANYNGLGSSGGTASGNKVSDISAAVTTPGNIYGDSQGDAAQIFTGSFVAGSQSLDTLSVLNDFADGTGSIHVNTTANGEKTITLNGTTESSSDPYAGYTPLTVTEATSPVPEPASLAIFGVAGAGLLIRKRRCAE